MLATQCLRSGRLAGRQFSTRTAGIADDDVVVLTACRTPITAAFSGALKSVPATQLGGTVLRGCLDKLGFEEQGVAERIGVSEIYLGHVLSAGVGQAPGTQALHAAGLPFSVPCTTINKVCASGMKAVMLAALSLKATPRRCVLAGGMESMSLTPHYLPTSRTGHRYGNATLLDGVMHDGLTDGISHFPMGNAGEHIAKTLNLTRADQDAFALKSYQRAQQAQATGLFSNEIVPVHPPASRKETPPPVTVDEEPARLDTSKIATLKPAFDKDGTITAFNASKLNDGAAALLLTTYGHAKSLGRRPLARIMSFADAARAPIEFTIAPTDALNKAFAFAGIGKEQIDYHEINEAFASVVLANAKLMDLDVDRINVNGGACALGHPIGASGARIITTLINVLQQKDASIGAASICNGGGGASAIVLERLQ